jgi:hypothetical protein
MTTIFARYTMKPSSHTIHPSNTPKRAQKIHFLYLKKARLAFTFQTLVVTKQHDDILTSYTQSNHQDKLSRNYEYNHKMQQ